MNLFTHFSHTASKRRNREEALTTTSVSQTHDGLDPKLLDDISPMAGVVAPQKSRLALLDLPATLALLYFLNSCAQSFPMTATTGFINEEINEHLDFAYARRWRWASRGERQCTARGSPVRPRRRRWRGTAP